MRSAYKNIILIACIFHYSHTLSMPLPSNWFHVFFLVRTFANASKTKADISLAIHLIVCRIVASSSSLAVCPRSERMTSSNRYRYRRLAPSPYRLLFTQLEKCQKMCDGNGTAIDRVQFFKLMRIRWTVQQHRTEFFQYWCAGILQTASFIRLGSRSNLNMKKRFHTLRAGHSFMVKLMYRHQQIHSHYMKIMRMQNVETLQLHKHSRATGIYLRALTRGSAPNGCNHHLIIIDINTFPIKWRQRARIHIDTTHTHSHTRPCTLMACVRLLKLENPLEAGLRARTLHTIFLL